MFEKDILLFFFFFFVFLSFFKDCTRDLGLTTEWCLRLIQVDQQFDQVAF